MNKVSKILLLILILAIPVGIFLFLKTFGENRFDIPVYYEAGVEPGYADCNYPDGQFYVSDTLIHAGKNNLIMFFTSTDAYNQTELSNQMARLKDLFADDMPVVTIFATQSLEGIGGDIDFQVVSSLDQLMKCGLVTDQLNQFILIDTERRIRGYFDTELDEIDRLIVEIKILLENGSHK